ncbi:MAG: hypothetical protein M1825_004973 [Sarcosagium campestre]|nr:MAG: hypothetical protein M1825_004973 [Sarcosagium campestre]
MSIELVNVPAHHALRQAADGLQSARRGLVVELPFNTTVKKTLKVVEEAIEGEGIDPSVMVFKPPRPGIGPKLRALALEVTAFETSSASKPKQIQSTVDLGSDPIRRPRPSILAALRENAKENAKPWIRPQDPHVLVIEPKLDEAKLASIPCRLTLSALGGAEQVFRLDDQEALWDTGAHMAVITEDLLDEAFLQHLTEPIHDPYRNRLGTQVTCSLRLGFSNQAIEMDLIMLVTKREHLPNHRSGIILGQHTCLNRVSYTSTPAAVMRAKGQHIPENLWGRLELNDYFDLHGKIVEF